jgi:hypothetical protein
MELDVPESLNFMHGGRLPVAAAPLNDAIGLFHPRHSWTGRFPPDASGPTAPCFKTSLSRESGGKLLTPACNYT